nr:MAG TPA: hypothetical protein [Caudoviricetes sp.]
MLFVVVKNLLFMALNGRRLKRDSRAFIER